MYMNILSVCLRNMLHNIPHRIPQLTWQNIDAKERRGKH